MGYPVVVAARWPTANCLRSHEKNQIKVGDKSQVVMVVCHSKLAAEISRSFLGVCRPHISDLFFQKFLVPVVTLKISKIDPIFATAVQRYRMTYDTETVKSRHQ